MKERIKKFYENNLEVLNGILIGAGITMSVVGVVLLRKEGNSVDGVGGYSVDSDGVQHINVYLKNGTSRHYTNTPTA